MSTRCQLRFVRRIDQEHDGASEAPGRIAQVYRHSDGYPESVLPDLLQLKRLLDRTKSERGPDYAAAQFIFLGKLRTMSMYLGRDPDMSIRAIKPADVLEPGNWTHLNQPAFILGHGVENPSDGIHGDEEYLYLVELPDRIPVAPPEEWTVKVSDHCGFPRWDGPTDEAFEQASWQFEGPLSEALEVFNSTSR